jgi:hypothetical protein
MVSLDVSLYEGLQRENIQKTLNLGWGEGGWELLF